MDKYLLRSLMFVPGHNERLLSSAARSVADVFLLDIEDSVLPESNIIPVDTVHINLHDLEDLEKNLKVAKRLGFEGMLILHPKELALAHQYFSPSEQDVKNSKEMLHLAEEAQKGGKGVALMNGKFIGSPMI